MQRILCDKIQTAAVFGAITLAFAATSAARPPAWPEDLYTRQLVEQVLPETTEQWDGEGFARHGSRGATYIALGLLWRDGPHDRAAAAAILRGVLALQYEDGPDSKLYGVWRTRQGETKPDSNWREFIGCGLILILETFPDRIPADLARDVRAALLRAARGAAQRNVGADYTNIALMSAFLLDYVGAKENDANLQQLGQDKAEAIYELFSRHKTFHEYNSPTYYGTDLMALALWRRHACSERMRDLGRRMEADLWRDIGAFYHAGMRNMCGPFVRAYGMDMTQYCALTGLWIALAVGDPALAPWPASDGHHGGERVYGPVFALLGPNVPDEVLPHLRHFSGAGQFERRFRDTRATVLMEENLMMGAAALERQWDQHHPATIYWKSAPGKPVGWILLTGLNDGVVPEVSDRCLRIQRQRKSDVPIQFLVFAPGLNQAAITPNRWNLPGLCVAVQAADGVALERVREIDHLRYGRCLEIHYATPADTTDALLLRPQVGR